MRSTRNAPSDTTTMTTAQLRGLRFTNGEGIQRREPRVTVPRAYTAAMLSTMKPYSDPLPAAVTLVVDGGDDRHDDQAHGAEHELLAQVVGRLTREVVARGEVDHGGAVADERQR